MADQIFYVALSWQLSQASSAATLGLTMTLNAVCRIAFLPIGGVAADRIGHKRMSILTESIRLTVFILGMCYLMLGFGSPDARFLILFAIFLGLADAFYLPSTSALIGEVEEYISLSSAVSARSLLQRGAFIIGPALGGKLIASSGLAITLGVAGLSCILSLLALFILRSAPPEKTTVEKASLLTDFSQGLKHVITGHSVFSAFLLIIITEFIFEGLFDVGVPLLVSSQGWDSNMLGSLLSLFGVGAAISALVTGKLFRGRLSMSFAFKTTCMFGVFILAMGLLSNQILVMACSIIAGLLCGASSIATNYVIFDNTSKEQLGRVSSMTALASNGTAPLSYMVVGFAAGKIGINMTFVIGGALLLSSVPIIWLMLQLRSNQRNTL
ncbi:MFS transporter [Bombiscardovia coagulans]|uniref:MFS transporter n=1 Tax=Bombiscardovia coagulans TaxID=686666 RepID=UPI001314D930|nr:MFS transporter [Bombiscardovia coagulans]